MFKLITFLLTFMISIKIAYGNYEHELANIAHLAKVLTKNSSEQNKNSTLVGLPLYQMLVILFETASLEVKDELSNFFPYPLNGNATAALTSLLKKPTNLSELYSFLYIFLNQNKVKHTWLDENSSILSNELLKQIKFNPTDSIDLLNHQIAEDHKGTIEEALKDENLSNTIAFLVSTLFIDTKWKEELTERNIVFKVKENHKIVEALSGNRMIKYYTYDNNKIIHLPADDNIYLAIKIAADGSVSTISADELLQGDVEQVEFELPKFTIENSINLISELKILLPLTFSEAGFQSLLSKNNEKVVIDKFQQKNRLELTKKGITAKSVAVAKILFRSQDCSCTKVKINGPFSFLLYRFDDGVYVPLLSGELYDPYEQSPKVSLTALTPPKDPIAHSFFNLMNYQFQQTTPKEPWGKENSLISPISFLIALNNASKIYDIKNNVDIFLSRIGFLPQLSERFITQLMINDLKSLNSKQSLEIPSSENETILRTMLGLNEETKSFVEWFLEKFFSTDPSNKIFEQDDGILDWANAIEYNEEIDNLIAHITETNWQKLAMLSSKVLDMHLKGKKNQSILELSNELLGEDNAKLLFFLHRFSSLRSILTTTKERKKMFAALSFLGKNRQLLLIYEEIKPCFFNTYEDRQSFFQDITCQRFFHNRICAASIFINPVIKFSLNPKSEFINRHDLSICLYFIDRLHIEKNKISGTVRGRYQEDKHGITIAIPAFGDLFLIIRHKNNLAEPIVFFEGGEKKEFFITIPLIISVKGIIYFIPPGSENGMKVVSVAEFNYANLLGEEALSDKPDNLKIIIDEPFSFALAKKINEKNEQKESYAILLTGVYHP